MDALNRTFIAIRVPLSLLPKIAEVQQTIRYRAGADVVRWIPNPELQIVVMALGEVSLPSLEQIQRIIGPMMGTFPPLKLALEGLVGSPSNLQPRFIAVGVTGDVPALTNIHNQLEAKLLPVLRDHVTKPFQPHVDLGRIKIESEQNRTALGRAIKMAQLGNVASFDVNAIELLRNVTTATGPSLELIKSYSLGVPATA